MSRQLRQVLHSRVLSPDQQLAVFSEIHNEVLRHSRHMTEPNFRSFHPDDLEFMFHQYDQRVLDGACTAALDGRRIDFVLSRRMTRSGGKTTWKTIHNRLNGSFTEEFEIAVSAHLLFQSFKNEERDVIVTGMECHNRLQAMQRIVEHEMIHLAERLAWQNSDCRAARFQTIAKRLFGHRAHTHDLVTTREIARNQHGIRPGVRVAFSFEGRRHEGIVNRITKRVTVLVPDASGMPYSDGHRYQKYYIPLNLLQSLD